jgi:hypothetical protein
MEMNSSLFDLLPKPALLDFLSSYLSMRDVCRLDAAVSGTANRQYWLQCLQDCLFYGSRDRWEQYSKSSLRWIFIRQVSVLHLVCRQVEFCFRKWRVKNAEDVDDECMAYLPRSLVSLSLTSCVYVGEEGVATAVTRCSKLTSLILDDPRGRQAFSAISDHCPNLSHLSVGCVQRAGLDYIDEEVYQEVRKILVNCPFISSLDIQHIGLPSKFIRCITTTYGPRFVRFVGGRTASMLDDITENCPRLQHLYLCDEGAAVEQVIQRLQRCPDIQHLEAVYRADGRLDLIVKRYPALKSFLLWCLARDTNTDADIIDMLQRLRGLEALEALGLVFVQNLTDVCLAKIAELLPQQLTFLSLNHCDNISVVGLTNIADRCRNLRGVQIWNCPLVTDDSYHMLAEKWTQLERLEIMASDISDAGVLAIHRHCKQLKSLYFARTPNISKDMRAQLFHLFRGVKFELQHSIAEYL